MEEKDIQTSEEENDQEIIDADDKPEVELEDNNDTSVNEDEFNTLKQEVEQLQKEKDDAYQRLLRQQAEFDNFKKRTQKEKEADRKYKSQDLVNELLPAIDNFERALQVEVDDTNKNLVEGITMVYNQLIAALSSQGVEVIETVDKEFDPNYHHAVMQVEEEDKDSNIIVEELQKGYLLKDRVIRPAMVKVNK
ncbi:nucleotide exchange factor GrpE [Ornithinibacillus halophilus]|uniref:Protein GrpE n=1 Tax=Ornithinibacillus halophilus TaxID=930117 RepID=A0A1M5DLB8_9BACI|nr:nucleotide exchange factor GrpE [Ornithinibacillus halophilus]SHF67818.1 molecular chaperone GrpE [Ornithinibacillus halophilus]